LKPLGLLRAQAAADVLFRGVHEGLIIPWELHALIERFEQHEALLLVFHDALAHGRGVPPVKQSAPQGLLKVAMLGPSRHVVRFVWVFLEVE